MFQDMAGKTLAIVSAGGECPGITRVARALFRRATELGMRVVGILNGMDGLLGSPPGVVVLDERFFRWTDEWRASLLGTSRTGFTKKPELLSPALEALTSPPICADYLATIGGDDTFTSMIRLIVRSAEIGRLLRGVHLPKSIDNDLPLPEGVSTFGFDTAAEVGADMLYTFAGDFGGSPDRLCLAVCMGRNAGFLALEVARKAERRWGRVMLDMGRNVRRPYVFLPEMLPRDTPLERLLGALEKACVATQAARSADHIFAPAVIVVAEGFFGRLDAAGEKAFQDAVSTDDAGNIELAEIPLAHTLCRWLKPRLKRAGCRCKLRPEGIAYATRTHLPLSKVDECYTEQLGRGAVDYLAGGGSGGMVWIEGNELRSLPHNQVRRNADGTVKTRSVDLGLPWNREFLSETLALFN